MRSINGGDDREAGELAGRFLGVFSRSQNRAERFRRLLATNETRTLCSTGSGAVW